ncbi:hypothetical protein [Kribbella sp. NPDC055071]
MAEDGIPGPLAVEVWTEPGDTEKPNEDWHFVDQHIPGVVLLDGGTARTGTGCRHGVAWFTSRLGTALRKRLPTGPLPHILHSAIEQVASEHRATCDLSHPATPSAAVGIVRRHTADTWEYLVLGDITLLVQNELGLTVIEDLRINAAATAERAAADRFPIGTAEKTIALVKMKHAELSERNRTYWTAAADPTAAEHAIVGTLNDVARIALLTDGAARAHTFGLANWAQVLTRVTEPNGPQALIKEVRETEESDESGRKFPRNKRSDDATAVGLTTT